MFRSLDRDRLLIGNLDSGHLWMLEIIPALGEVCLLAGGVSVLDLACCLLGEHALALAGLLLEFPLVLAAHLVGCRAVFFLESEDFFFPFLGNFGRW